MELEYLYFLCFNLIGQKKDFDLLYNKYLESHCDNSTEEFCYKEDLVEFMIEILKGDNDYDFTEDSRLPDLLEYASEIAILKERKKALIYNNAQFISEEVLGYDLVDSHLLRFEINERKKQGVFFFCNVIFFQNEEMAESANIKVTFANIHDLNFKGCFDFEFLNGATCYLDEFTKVSPDRYKLSMMFLVNYEYFIIEFTFSSWHIDKFEYDWDSRYNWIK